MRLFIIVTRGQSASVKDDSTLPDFKQISFGNDGPSMATPEQSQRNCASEGTWMSLER